MRATLAPAALLLLAAGCGVQQDRYDNLLEANRSLEEQNINLADQQRSSDVSVDQLASQLAAARSEINTLQGRNRDLNDEVRQMANEYDALLGRVSSLQVGPLPPDVESAVAALARSYPQLITFDADRGMLRFASDFTFDLGSADLQNSAADSIASLGDILSGPSASNLEVRVVGHTDDVPIGKPETRRLHPTNMHLSVHRAISVRDALVNAGVAAERIQVAGYGPYRPIVANGSKGAAENRRVEIYLAPMRAAMPSSRTTPSPAVQADTDPMK